MAVGSIVATKRCIHGVQQATKHSECWLESKPEHFEGKECGEKSKLQFEVHDIGELAKSLDYILMVHSHGCPLHMEIPPIQETSCVRGHELLPLHSQRSCRDIKAQHGFDPSTCFKEQPHLASVYTSSAFHTFQ